jgi:hypothetical protein
MLNLADSHVGLEADVWLHAERAGCGATGVQIRRQAFKVDAALRFTSPLAPLALDPVLIAARDAILGFGRSGNHQMTLMKLMPATGNR